MLQLSSHGHPLLLFNGCKKSRLLLHPLLSEHHVIKTGHLSYSNSTDSRFLSNSNRKLLAYVTTQSQILHILIFLTVLPALFVLRQTQACSCKLQHFSHEVHSFLTFSHSVLTSGTIIIISPKTTGTL